MALEQYGNKIIRTRENGTVAFELSDNDLFYMTGYKVIQNFPGGGLLSAMKTQLNGRVRLIFDVNDYIPAIMLLNEMTPDQFSMMVLSLVSLCERIRSNGFIQGENVCLEEDMLFVDRATWQVWLIYVPLKQSVTLTMQLDSLDRHLIDLLKGMMTVHPSILDSRTRLVQEYISGGNRDITRIREILISAGVQPVVTQDDKRVDTQTTSVPDSLILERIGGSQSLLLHIPSKGAVIGKDDTYSQILIPDPSVSKKHCLIHREGGTWMIEDLQSTNHTWVGEGGAPLTPYMQHEIKPGDVVKISRFLFQVKAGIGD